MGVGLSLNYAQKFAQYSLGNFLKCLPIMLLTFPIMSVLCSKVIQYFS